MPLLGNHTIVLFNHDKNVYTGRSIGLFSTYSFLPRITRPTRITFSSAISIDNILTNNVDNISILINASLLKMWLITTQAIIFMGSLLLKE